jgi:hypothetical protein
MYAEFISYLLQFSLARKVVVTESIFNLNFMGKSWPWLFRLSSGEGCIFNQKRRNFYEKKSNVDDHNF